MPTEQLKIPDLDAWPEKAVRTVRISSDAYRLRVDYVHGRLGIVSVEGRDERLIDGLPVSFQGQRWIVKGVDEAPSGEGYCFLEVE